MARILTLGEALGVAWTEVGDPLRTASTLHLSIAGAEATVAVGLRRLGHDAVWLGVVGADPIGQRIQRELAAEGVDLAFVRVTAEAPTGFMLRDRGTAEHLSVTYLRAGSAGSRLTPADIDQAFDTAAPFDLLHLTGITAALSNSCHEAVEHAVSRARAAGVAISFDVNARTTLPGSRYVADRARALLEHVDVLFVGHDELSVLTEVTEAGEAARHLLASGPREVIIKQGARGARAYLHDGTSRDQPGRAVAVADVIGAGDSFVAGYLAGWCEGQPLDQRLSWAIHCAALTVGTHGDWEGLPTAAELAAHLDRGPDLVTIR